MAFGDSDLSTFFSDFAVPVVFNGVTAKGIVDAYDQSDGVNQAYANIDERYTDVALPSNAFAPFPKQGDMITLDGASVAIREITQERDGAVTHLFVVKP